MAIVGELVARIFLNLKFYMILKTNFKHPLGEIDIIARKGKTIIFIEVKSRKNIYFDLPITQNQKQRITRSSQCFIQNKYENYNIRYDLIIIRPFRWPYHIKNFIE